MLDFVLWYLLVSMVGWLTFPLAFTLFPALKDRGYAFSRSLGWLLWGYLFWLLASLGILRNDAGSLLLALALLAGLSALFLRRTPRDAITIWWRSQRGLVLAVEALFLIAFAGWAVVRSANPEILGTEKPMELAFINAILRSPTFPPHDPWLSGYAISYYHFGYVLVAMLARLAGVPGGVAFNLGIALVFALSAVGAFGMLYNLLARRSEPAHESQVPTRHFVLPALLGPLFILLVSNLEGFLHALHNRGLFWIQDKTGQLVSSFWSWLDIKDLNLPPAQPYSWVPDQFYWWWRASRVIQDYDFLRNPREIINEFPFFSYLLADLHPHVLAMPFAFLSMALALNLFLGAGRGRLEWVRLRLNLRTLAWGALLSLPLGVFLLWTGVNGLNLRLVVSGLGITLLGGVALLRFVPTLGEHGRGILARRDLGALNLVFGLQLDPATFLLGAVILGGMAFLNTWDFPVYVALFCAAYAYQRARQNGWSGRRADQARSEQSSAGFVRAAADFITLGLAIGLAGVLLYLPFYLGFSSQAGGILPNLIYITRGAHFWVMFAPLLLPLAAYLLYLAFLTRHRPDAGNKFSPLRTGTQLAAGLLLGMWALSLLFGIAILFLPEGRDLTLGSLAAPDAAALLKESLARRLESPGAWISLAALLALTFGLLLRFRGRGEQQSVEAGEALQPISSSQATQLLDPSTFVLLLTLLGALLVLGPEFFFLRDQFGWRINTIFKFYFQAWLLWGIAAAYGTAVLLKELRRTRGFVFRLGLLILITLSLVYPVFSLWNKTGGFRPATGWTLDGTAYLERQSPAEMAAIDWLKTAPPGVIAEAVGPGGGSYSQYARASMLSGLPAVLGWVGHENQWRGGGLEIGSRQVDIERLYCSRDWVETQAILDRYSIRYIFLGDLERVAYQSNEGNCPNGVNQVKFDRFLNLVFQQGEVAIYEVPGMAAGTSRDDANTL